MKYVLGRLPEILWKGITVTSHHSHDHDACIETALADAERICAARGLRFTDLRKQVLKMVWESHKAVKAYDLLDQLAAKGGSAKPPTVYRALDFLMEEGLVHKIESLNAYVGCPHPDDLHVSQFLICDICQNVEEVTSVVLTDSLLSAARQAEFDVSRQTVELHGTCGACRQIEAARLS